MQVSGVGVGKGGDVDDGRVGDGVGRVVRQNEQAGVLGASSGPPAEITATHACPPRDGAGPYVDWPDWMILGSPSHHGEVVLSASYHCTWKLTSGPGWLKFIEVPGSISPVWYTRYS